MIECNWTGLQITLQLFAQQLLPINWLLIAFSLLQLHLLLFLSILLKLIQSFNKIQMILISQKYQISFKDYQKWRAIWNSISYETIKDNDEQCFLLTGLKKDVLQGLIIYLKNYHSETYRTGIPSEDQIILTSWYYIWKFGLSKRHW